MNNYLYFRFLPFLIMLTVVFLCSCSKTQEFSFDINSGDATKTLKKFALQAEVDILIDETQLKEIQTQAVNGKMSVEAALKRMTSGTDLVFYQDKDSKAIVVFFNNRT